MDELLKCETEVGTLADMLEYTRQNGFWAYSDGPKRTVHAWFPPNTDAETMLMVLGHEAGHLLEGHGITESDQRDEADADEYGIATVFAVRMMNEITAKWRVSNAKEPSMK